MHTYSAEKKSMQHWPSYNCFLHTITKLQQIFKSQKKKTVQLQVGSIISRVHNIVGGRVSNQQCSV